MPEPIITSSLVYLGSTIVKRVFGKAEDAAFNRTWEAFRRNLQQHREHPNQELQRAVYRAYYQATLQTCATQLERKGIKIDGWFRLGVLPEKMAEGFRSLLTDTPVGIFTEATKQWLEQVSRDQLKKLKQLDNQSFAPSIADDRELTTALSEIELLMRPEGAANQQQSIGKALTERVLDDLAKEFGEPPPDFAALARERWFEFLCANFQFFARQQPVVANAFQNTLLAELAINQKAWQAELTGLGGETLRRIEASQAWLANEQREGFARIEASVELFLPLLSFARDQKAFNDSLSDLIRAESGRVIDVIEDTGDRVVAEIKQSLKAYEFSTEPEPLIQTLPMAQEIEGREAECDQLLRALSAPSNHVSAFAAPGGFGKTALLTKLIQKISVDGRTLSARAMLSNGDAITPSIGALLHVDGREGVSLGVLFENAGRLVGERQAFKDLYADTNKTLRQKLSEIFVRLSRDAGARTWFVFDNFEPLLDEHGAVIDGDLREFFGALFAGGHSVYALIVGRDLPVFSPHERIVELRTIGDSLYAGLPLADCVAYLKKNGAADGLTRGGEEIDRVLADFATRVHRIPLALVWAVGYLSDTGYTLNEVLARTELFADFDRGQTKEAEDYRYKGLKRLHYDQLQRQPEERLPVLCLLAFFKRLVPKGALEHLLDEIELNRALTRLARSKLLTHAESADGYARYINDPLEVHLYGLHPIICENEFFATFPEKEALYENSARECWKRAASAYKVNRFAYVMELLACAETLFEYLARAVKRVDLLNDYASMLMNKGVVLDSLHRLEEAVAEYDKAIAILERLVNIGQTDRAHHLAKAYLNKGVSLQNLQQLGEAAAEYDKAIEILERLVDVEQQTHLANDLAAAYMNKGVVLRNLQRLQEAVAEYDKAIAIRERLVKAEQPPHLANELAKAYVNKGVALDSLQQFGEAVAEYDKAIAIRERLVNVEQQAYLANDLASAYVNKGNTLHNLKQLREAVVQFDKAIAILERLVDVEQQTHLANVLATAYLNKALVVEKQEDWTAALHCYEAAVQRLLFCLEKLGMFWIIPELLQTRRYRLMTLLDLRRWPVAAQDVHAVLNVGLTFLESQEIRDELRQATQKEVAYMIIRLRELGEAERDLVYAELGEAANIVRALVSDKNDNT